ncbi:BMP family protein [Halobacteriaceae archaeon GCM10025711]
MADTNRRKFLKLAAGIGAVGTTGFAGCLGGGPTDEGSDETTTEETTTASETTAEETTTAESDSVDVGMVYATGGLGDGSFNDQAQQGIKQAVEDFGISYDKAQPSEVSQFKNYQQQFAKSTNPDYDLVSTIGYLQADALTQTAEQYPDQQFMIVDSVVDKPNVGSYVFQEHEGSFLVGQLAGLLTGQEFSAGSGSTKPDELNVGFVGGVEGALIGKFEAGFIAGVKHANSDVTVQSTYVGSFNDPTGGKEAALAMYNNGADIVYHASGNTGTGVFQAAQEKGRFAIGVDRDQSVTKESYADVILASMVKRVDTAVYNAIEAVVNDNFEGGALTTLGLQKDGVAIAYGQSLGGDVPSDVKDAVTSSRQSIIDGDISVPTDPKNA